MKLTETQVADFQQAVLAHYDQHARHSLPWRIPEADGSFDAYKIWVSELMLQQTQVGRVIPKYEAFLARFPTVQTLAAAELGEVLIAWQGLGYNRRAKFLWQAAQQVVQHHGGEVPATLAELVSLPGIGHNTAGAILAYAFNQPVVFVETNIRTVYFHHFFNDETDISDKQLLPLIEQTMTTEPRDFYWALMDYGSYLKKQGQGKIAKSKHYSKQSAFEGSARQLRGRVLRLLAGGPMPAAELAEILADTRSEQIIEQLKQEGFIRKTGQDYQLA